MTDREELDALSSRELHDRATRLAWRRLDVGFLWDLLKTIPEAEAAAGHVERGATDVIRPLALLNDFIDADRGELADALRPLYIDYLLEHEGAEPEGEAPEGGGSETAAGSDTDG